MKRKRLDEELRAHDRAKEACVRWMDQVWKIRKDAPAELWNIIAPFEPPPPNLTVILQNNAILFDSEWVYIYTKADGLVYYGPHQKLWPVQNMSIWPWAVVNKPAPPLPKDVWGHVFKFLSVLDVFQLSYTCKAMRSEMKKSIHWVARLDHLRPCIDIEPCAPGEEWKFFSSLVWAFENRSPYEDEALNRAIQFSFPIGVSASLFKRTWATKEGDFQPTIVNPNGRWKKWITFTAHRTIFMVGRAVRQRNFCCTTQQVRMSPGVTLGELFRPLRYYITNCTPRPSMYIFLTAASACAPLYKNLNLF
jgi:F-box domain